MPVGPGCTAADAERALRALQRDPAAQAYGDYIREKAAGRDPFAREAERVRLIMQAVAR